MIETLREGKEIYKYRELLRNLVLRDLKVRYKRSVIGFIWVMLHPLLMMLILYIVFSELFKVSIPNFSAYLISGIILWGFFSQSTSAAVISFIGNSNLIKKVYIPKAILPLSTILSAFAHFLFAMIPLFAIFFITGVHISFNVYLLPVIFVMIAMFSFGISLILATATVFFHDVRYIYEVLLLAWMYMTPIFYPESIVPERYMLILELNPFYYFISVFRGSLYLNVPMFYEKMLFSLLFAIFIFTTGWLFYSKYRHRIIYYL